MRILLVDDESTIREVLCTALELVAGHRVLACDSAAAALAAVREFTPDLLLLDLMMPDVDGIDTLRALRELPGTSATPVVFISATVDPRMLARARVERPLAVLEKPLNVVTLGASLERLWSAARSGDAAAAIPP